MATKPSNANVNNGNHNTIYNNTTNYRHVNTNLPRKEKPNWYTRTIIGAIITLLLYIAGGYIKSSISKSDRNPFQLESTK